VGEGQTVRPLWGRFCNKPAQDIITWPIEIQLLIALRLAASGWESTMSRCAGAVAPRVQAAHDPYRTLLKVKAK
jgi:hypothetical protein